MASAFDLLGQGRSRAFRFFFFEPNVFSFAGRLVSCSSNLAARRRGSNLIRAASCLNGSGWVQRHIVRRAGFRS